MSTEAAGWLISRNPATGEELGRFQSTDADSIAGLVDHSRLVANDWKRRPLRKRIEAIRQWWAILSRDAEPLADAIRAEIGKPRPEAQMEVTAALDAIRWIVKNARSTLADSRIGTGWQWAALMSPARLRWAPVGLAGIIGTWNYPVLLDAPAIAGALVAGNAVAWKPSELCIGVADRLRSTLAEAGVPDGLVVTLFGGPDVGRSLVASKIDKAFFTGGVGNGRSIAAALAARGIPMVAELSGFDPAIILPDAPMEATVRALTWAAFVGTGQTCVSIKRVIVIGDPKPWIDAINASARSLRVGDPARSDVDVGPLISQAAREKFHQTIVGATAAGATIAAGGKPIDGPGAFYEPTVLLASDHTPENVLEGVFGPVIVIRSVKDEQEAVEAANAGTFGLAASVWGRDRTRARAVADRLEVGMVTINDAVTPSGLAAAPFGGVKASGFGRVRGVLGLREFTAPQVIHERSPGGLRLHLFPYSDRLGKVFAFYRRLFHPRA